MIYVCKSYGDPVKENMSLANQKKFFTVYRGANPEFSISEAPVKSEVFEILYTGGMRGWLKFYPQSKNFRLLKLLLRIANSIGTYRCFELDVSSHTPIFIGRAIKSICEKHPEWEGRIHFTQLGCSFTKYVTDEVLKSEGLTSYVSAVPPVTQEQVIERIKSSQMLFMNMHTLKGGGESRIFSGKTFEYLLTNRPILASFPEGENRKILAESDGVWITDPYDVEAMEDIILERMKKFTSGETETFDRSSNYGKYGYDKRAEEFNSILSKVLVN